MHFILKTLIAFAALGTIAMANPFLPDCATTTSDETCMMHWVNNGQHFTLTANPPLIDLEATLTTDEAPTLHAHNTRPPYHVDINHDGFMDMVFFTRIGMVNGDFTFYLFNPTTNTYAKLGTANGSHFNTDKSGYLVAIGRSSCCESGADFHTISNNKLTLQFQMDIRPAELATDTEQCTVIPVDGGQPLDALKRKNAKMIAAYCDMYQDAGSAKILARSIHHGTPYKNFHNIAPNTVFYCQIDGTDKHVEITRGINTFTYNYGTVGQKPDLTFTAAGNDATYLPDNGAGTTRFGYIKLKTGDYTYQTHYAYQINLLNDAATVSDTTYGLIVEQDGKKTAIFDKSCTPKSVLNLIPELDFDG